MQATLLTTSATASSAVCPMHALHDLALPDAGLAADDLLVLPLHQRVVVQYATAPGGATELRLFYGDKEISFDEPEFFAFGKTLARQSRFAAGQATTWGAGRACSRCCNS